ncbi:MAG: hypothetical protein EBX35_15805 [Planctomycetia bacterium]|nr:hypothetical protein [Planctomycetia bacterium]
MPMHVDAPRAPVGRGGRESSIEVERGPDWLFVRVAGAAFAGQGELTRSVWEAIREHGASRVVLELDHVDTIDEALGGAIGEIGTRVRDAGGLIRICGLSEPKLARLRSVAAAAGVPHFDTRSDAVGGRGAGA